MAHEPDVVTKDEIVVTEAMIKAISYDILAEHGDALSYATIRSLVGRVTSEVNQKLYQPYRNAPTRQKSV